MTTKFKIILGFVSMMVILIVVSILAYRYMSLTLTNVMEYRRSVWVNVDLLDTLAAVNETRGQMNRYLIDSDKGVRDNILKAADTLTEKIDHAAKNMALQENKDIAQRIHKSTLTYREDLVKVTANVTKLHEVYASKVIPASQVITGITGQFRETARSANKVPVLAGLEAMWEEYAYMLSNLGRFYYSRSEDDVKLTRQRYAAAQKLGEGIAQYIVVEQGRVHHRNMMNAYKAIADAIDEMAVSAKTCQTSIAAMRSMNASIRADLTTLNEHFNAQRLAIGNNITADITGGERILLTGSVVGVVLGLILALIIIFGLIRVLREAGHYAAAVAGGDFDYVPKVKEGGEIGAMFTSMHQIPTVLSELVDKSEALADGILSGHLRNRLDVTRFSGEFGHLTNCVNKVSDAYTRLIDRLGIPFICCDSGCRINFVNEPGQQVLGGNPIGRLCAEELKAPTCNTDKCFGKGTMSKNGPLRGETTVNVRGNVMEVEVDAVPLRNLKNEVVGFMELLTDLTEVKSHEATMLRVAEEANEISNRVAAASEELSTQVDLITRGTDVQRDRVSSTASAMTEMNATVLEVARSAGEASEQSEGTRVKAQQGAELVNQVVTAINAVNKIGENLQTNMQELGKQAESIGNVMNVISDIADQTNLLALNAAIEAARAGEAGRGFAVVADEVRKLAEKTMQATHEVGASINAVQQSARVNIEEVGKAVTSVAEANTLANSSGEALKEIVTMAASNSSVVASIATAAEEQSATSEEINRAIEEIHKVVGETADSMVQSSAAVQILSQMAHELRRVMDGLK